MFQQPKMFPREQERSNGYYNMNPNNNVQMYNKLGNYSNNNFIPRTILNKQNDYNNVPQVNKMQFGEMQKSDFNNVPLYRGEMSSNSNSGNMQYVMPMVQNKPQNMQFHNGESTMSNNFRVNNSNIKNSPNNQPQGQYRNNLPKVNVLQNLQLNQNAQNNYTDNKINHGYNMKNQYLKKNEMVQSTAHKSQHNVNVFKPDTTNKVFKPNGSRLNEKMFILTGNIERILHWNVLLSDSFFYFEVIASVISLQDGNIRTQKIMLLRNKSGPILQVIYYLLTHLAIEDFYLGKMVRVIGRMIGPNIINAISIRDASEDEIESLPRLAMISDQAVNMHLKEKTHFKV